MTDFSMDSATTRNVLHSLLPPPSATSQNYDLRPRRAGEGRRGREDAPPHLSPPARDLGRRCNIPHSGVRDEASSATWRFVTFYRLTKPLLMLILLILNFKKISQQRGRGHGPSGPMVNTPMAKSLQSMYRDSRVSSKAVRLSDLQTLSTFQ